MTRDDVIRWARVAGFEQQIRTKERRVVVLPDAMFERFAAKVAANAIAAEREACAQVADATFRGKPGQSVNLAVAAAIRARSKQPTQAQAGAVPLTCKWTHNADDSSWDTECGQSWRFDDGGPKENHMNFCHCCGKPLRIKGGQHG